MVVGERDAKDEQVARGVNEEAVLLPRTKEKT
jgi:hypothetical protein